MEESKEVTVEKLREEQKIINDAKHCIKQKIVGIEIYNTFSKLYEILSKHQGTIHFWKDGFGKKYFQVKVGESYNHIQKTYYDPDNIDSFVLTIEALIRWVEFVVDKDNQPV